MPRGIAKTTESNIFQKWEMPSCRRGNGHTLRLKILNLELEKQFERLIKVVVASLFLEWVLRTHLGKAWLT